METADQLARIFAEAARKAHPGTLVGVNAGPESKFGRLTIRTPEGVEFTVQIEEN